MSNSLLTGYQGLVCDLDGVVYRGSEPIPHAVESLTEAHDAGVHAIYATNNASRDPADVAAHLQQLGLPTTAAQVVTSSTAGAARLTELVPAGATVLAIGGEGVAAALAERGFTAILPQDVAGQRVQAVLQGYGKQVTATDLAEAAYAIHDGATWVATNTDRTLPTDKGIAPGNGTLVAAVGAAVDQEPVVVGKPGPLMYQLAAERLGTDADTTLGLGDRLETDVAGAHAAGMDCLFVLTGVHGPRDLVCAPAEQRPRYVAADLRALHEPYDEPVADGDSYVIGTIRARLGPNGHLECDGEPAGIQRLRLAVAVLWKAIDAGALNCAQACELLPEGSSV